MNKIIFFAFTVLISVNLAAQKKAVAQPELNSGTIEAQFDYIINKSTKFRDFQLIRKASILKVKAHTLDSIKTIRKELIVAHKSITNIEGSIGVLESEVTTLKGEIETISKDVDSISFMGITLSKSIYNVIAWSIIVGLLLALIVFMSMFKKSSITTKNAKTDLGKTNSEFEVFRKKALLKEQETMRKLQDELNKNG